MYDFQPKYQSHFFQLPYNFNELHQKMKDL